MFTSQRITPCLILLPMMLLSPPGGATDIYKCQDADGGIVYTHLPCKGEPLADTNDEADPVPETTVNESPVAEPDNTAMEDAIVDDEAESKTEEEVAACKKRYRDAIDEIDAELAREFRPEQAGEYKERLLELTRELRRC